MVCESPLVYDEAFTRRLEEWVIWFFFIGIKLFTWKALFKVLVDFLPTFFRGGGWVCVVGINILSFMKLVSDSDSNCVCLIPLRSKIKGWQHLCQLPKLKNTFTSSNNSKVGTNYLLNRAVLFIHILIRTSLQTYCPQAEYAL